MAAGGGVALAFLLCASSAAAAPDTSTTVEHEMARTEAQARAMYDLWLARHGRSYNALGEYDRRFRPFWDNLRFVDEHNADAGAHGHRLGMNRFADLTNEYRVRLVVQEGGYSAAA